MPRLVRLMLISALLVTGACGTEEPTGSANDDGESTESAELTVSAADFSFSPTELTVPAGTEVGLTFTNNGQSPHTFTSDDLGVDVRADPGATEEATFTLESGSAEFRCELHPQMTGTVSVEGAEAGGGGDGDMEKDRKDDAEGYDY